MGPLQPGAPQGSTPQLPLRRHVCTGHLVSVRAEGPLHKSMGTREDTALKPDRVAAIKPHLSIAPRHSGSRSLTCSAGRDGVKGVASRPRRSSKRGEGHGQEAMLPCLAGRQRGRGATRVTDTWPRRGMQADGPWAAGPRLNTIGPPPAFLRGPHLLADGDECKDCGGGTAGRPGRVGLGARAAAPSSLLPCARWDAACTVRKVCRKSPYSSRPV
jgi:hypothetical protein